MKGWDLEGGENIVLAGERLYVRDAVQSPHGNVVHLDCRSEDGVLVKRQVYTEQEVEVLNL